MSHWPEGVMGKPAQRAKVRMGQWLSNPVLGSLISSVYRNQIRSKSVVIDTSPPAFTAVVKAQLAFGIYESAEIRFIRQYLKGYSRVLELGTSLGVTAAHILDVAAPGAEVVCVEANPYILPVLQATTAKAAAKSGAKVKAIHGAISPDPYAHSPSVLLTLGTSSLGSRVGSDGSGDPAQQVPVPAVDLGALVEGWTDYALVCDIEGAEAALILSAEPVLSGARRIVIELHDIEYASSTITVDDLRLSLLNMGSYLVAENGRVLVLDGPASGGSGASAAMGKAPREKRR